VSVLSILAIEPYMAGSHRSFLDGLQEHSRHCLEVWGLPGRKWKWRMRASAINFAQDLGGLDRTPDLLLVSDYLDVAAFRALMPSRFAEIPILTYFHENQLTYPVQEESERDYQFVFTNITTCLASDRVLFNSDYHRESFLGALPSFLQRMPDHVPEGLVETIRSRSAIRHLGITVPSSGPEPVMSCARGTEGGKPRTVVWNHRWEYDKNPDLFFKVLFELDERGVEFSLVVLGESFKESPPIFKEAQRRLAHRLSHVGYAADRADYWRLLQEGDIVVSTALHEFFGLSVLEGIAAGCFPLLPNRLAYPELLPLSLHAECLYRTDEEFGDRLDDLLTHPLPPVGKRLQSVGKNFHWSARARDLDGVFEELVGQAGQAP